MKQVPFELGDEDVFKTTQTSLGQSIAIGTADQEEESTTSTRAETADDIGTNVRFCNSIFIFILYSRLLLQY